MQQLVTFEIGRYCLLQFLEGYENVKIDFDNLFISSSLMPMIVIHDNPQSIHMLCSSAMKTKIHNIRSTEKTQGVVIFKSQKQNGESNEQLHRLRAAVMPNPSALKTSI